MGLGEGSLNSSRKSSGLTLHRVGAQEIGKNNSERALRKAKKSDYSKCPRSFFTQQSFAPKVSSRVLKDRAAAGSRQDKGQPSL